MEKQYVYLISEIHSEPNQKINLITARTENAAKEFVQYYRSTGAGAFAIDIIIEKCELI